MTSTPTKARILKALNSANEKLAAAKRAREEPIAVIGMSSRFPGSSNCEAFWELLSKGKNSISEVPASRWNIDTYYDPDPGTAGKMSCRYGGFLDRVEQFDAQFFEISPREARSLDPQQRFLLEVSVEALEHGNQPLDKLSGSATGVFFGISSFDYANRFSVFEDDIDAHLGTGTLLSPSAGRLSYFLGSKGPSLVVDTACSSSLVALHQALASLRSQESNLAVVGAVSMILAPHLSIAFSKARMLSPEGRCKTFDASANGYVRSEGCGVVVLKRLSDAQKDRDNILALIRSSAVNQDGASGGLTIPSGPSQEAVIRQALRAARVTPADIDYVEAHGTGTSLGDPIEMNALGSVFADREDSLFVGSVKTNIGHAEAAAGMASLIKVIMSLQQEEIPQHLYFETPNPHVPWNTLSIEIPVKAQPWRRREQPRLAGISSFGFSGTNAHIVVAEAPPEADIRATGDKRPLHLLTLSAKVPAALEQQIEQYRYYFLEYPDLNIADVCFTANCGRTHFRERLALTVTDLSQAVEKLSAHQAGKQGDCTYRTIGSEPARVAFLFSDERSAFTGEKRLFYDSLPVFRSAVDHCTAALKANSDEGENDSAEHTTASRLFALEYAQARLWQSLGIEPVALLGQGLGAYVAACIAGVFSLEEALRMVVQRERFVRAAPDNAEHQLAAFKRSLETVAFKTPRIAVISAVATGENRADSQEYWIDQLAASTTLEQGMRELHSRGVDVFLGLGPGHAMLDEGRQSLPEGYGAAFSTWHDDVDDWAALLGPLAYLHARGEQIDWSAYHRDHACRGVALPTYPWQHERHWTENKKRAFVPPTEEHPILGRRIRSSILQPGQALFEARVGSNIPPYLVDHRLYENVVFPAAAYIEVALAAGTELFQQERSEQVLVLEHLMIEQPLFLPDDAQTSTVQSILMPDQSGYELAFSSLNQTIDGGWTRHVRCRLSAESRTPVEAYDLSALKSDIDLPIDIECYYQDFASVGVDYGPSFQLIRSLHTTDSGEVLGLIELPEGIDDSEIYHLHPLIMDGCLQLLAAALRDADDDETTYFLVQLARLSLFRRGTSKTWCYVHRSSEQGSGLLSSFDLHLLDDRGEVIAELQRLLVRRAGRDALLAEQTSNWLYDVTWERLPNNNVPPVTQPPGRWLILCDEEGIGRKLAEQLEARGGRCTLVSRGTSFEASGGDHYRLDPLDPRDFDRLFSETSPSESSAYEGIVHQWSMDRALDSSTVMDDALNLCGSVLYLLQALMRSASHQKSMPRLCLLTRNAQALETVPVALQRTPLWGLGRVIMLEHPALATRLVDLGDSYDTDVQDLLGEILSSEPEQQVAFRQGARHVARLGRANALQVGSTMRLDGEGVYLVTGGFGALGLQVARYLIAQGAGHLMLLGRRGAASDSARASVEALESAGALVHTVKVDIAKPDALSVLRTALEESGRPLRGVIHTAGVLDDGLLEGQSLERFATVMRPKVQGAWNLHRLTQEMLLDFFVCFSSMTASIGAMGQANYAAANSFMDALCHHRQALGLPATSIGWGPWGDSGMAAQATLQARWAQMGIGVIPPERGVALFGRLLGSRSSHVGAMPMEWAKYPYESRFFANFKQTPTKEVAESSAILEEVGHALAEDRETLLTDYLQDQICRILGYRTRTSFSTSQGFFELGMDSLSSIELRSILQKDLDCHLPSTLTFDHPTIKKLVDYLITELFEEEILEEMDGSHFDSSDQRIGIEQPEESVRQLTENDDPEEIAKRLAEQLGIEWE